ncbi:thioesterase II family protein [Actinokineospora bangkokensis]|uniref:Thioesterase domain-containing protein n=1 Tax=Actinokineospora bangkokensis TaxID=1193682 RepID=A0A1Q9LIM1_9PSEU|nr:alpha/beta fold hydrolase [Actinokineospora bangkokensis]OLR91876.1 hypothetical protein BJP25_23880 [Actinokineospora bangkokensis]
MRFADTHVLVERPDAAVRLFVLHHAGGSAMSYLPLAQAMPESCEPVLFDLPGRGTRTGTPPPADFRSAVDDLLPDLAALLDRPAVVFGHSLGALLAHGLLGALPPDRREQVRAVVVSAFTSPTDAAAEATHPAGPFLVRSRPRLLDELRDRGGCPPELFEEPELLEEVVTLMGHDLHLADTYPGSPVPTGDVDYHVWYGRQDDHLDVDAVERWALSTPHPPHVRGFRGGHFYLDGNPEVTAALARLVG